MQELHLGSEELICSSSSSREQAFVSFCLGAMNRTNKEDRSIALAESNLLFKDVCFILCVVFAPRVFVSKTRDSSYNGRSYNILGVVETDTPTCHT